MTTVALKKIIVASAKMTQKLVVGGNATGTAPVSEVLEGSTFSNMYAVDLVGTMPNIGAQNITPSTTEQTISEGYHDGSGKVAGDADLVAENIKKDVQIFGVTGTLESGTAATGNATVNQVLSGATFSNADDSGLTGTMPNIGAQNITPSASNQSISTGYHNGSGVVAGDADLIAGNIKKDTVIFGVTGTFEGDVSAYKTALDAANEESSVDLTAGIALVDTNYAEISAAITASGVSMTGVKPSGYEDKIKQIGDKYTRPSFWPELPAITVDENGQPTEQVYYGLVAVFPNGSNMFYTYLTDNVTIDWGDGSSEDVNANSGVFHDFTFEDAPGAVCERGYKMCIMSIRPRTIWDNLRYINTQSYGRSDDRATTLEIKAAFFNNPAYVDTIYIRMLPLLESIELVGSSNFTTYGIGNSCPSLRKVLVDVTNMATPGNFFRQDNKAPVELQTFFDISKATGSCDAMFLAINFKFGDIEIKTPTIPFTFTYNFYQTNVRSVIFDDMSRCTDMTASFSDCFQLHTLRMPGIKVSFYVGQCNLDVNALVALFGDLADMTGFTAPTITITGNPGASLLSAEQRAIATNKNWVIVG